MLCSGIVADSVGFVFEPLGSDAGFEVNLVIRDCFESVPRRLGLIMGIGFADLSLGVNFVDGEVTGAVEVQIRIERFGIEAIDGGRIFLRDVAVSHELADDRTVLAFGQRVIVGLARARLGEFHAQLLQESGDFVVDVLGSRV